MEKVSEHFEVFAEDDKTKSLAANWRDGMYKLVEELSGRFEGLIFQGYPFVTIILSQHEYSEGVWLEAGWIPPSVLPKEEMILQEYKKH